MSQSKYGTYLWLVYIANFFENKDGRRSRNKEQKASRFVEHLENYSNSNTNLITNLLRIQYVPQLLDICEGVLVTNPGKPLHETTTYRPVS